MGFFSPNSKPSSFLLGENEIPAQHLGYHCVGWSLDTANVLLDGILKIPTLPVHAPEVSVVDKLRGNPGPGRLQLLALTIATYYAFCQCVLTVTKATSQAMAVGTLDKLRELSDGAGKPVTELQVSSINAAVQNYISVIAQQLSRDDDVSADVLSPYGDPVCELAILNIFKAYQLPNQGLDFSATEAMMALTPFLTRHPMSQMKMMQEKLRLTVKG